MMRGENKVVVLGATGFLGAYSCLALKRAGYEVVAVGHRMSDGGFFADHGIDYVGGFAIERRDCFDLLPTDASAVVNLAGSMPARADFAQTDYIASIVTGTINLCEWLRAKTSCNVWFSIQLLQMFGMRSKSGRSLTTMRRGGIPRRAVIMKSMPFPKWPR